MKKVLSVLMASLVAFLMFGVNGGTALAAPKPVVEDCGCGIPVTGAEKNKIVSDLMKSDVFKTVKKQAENEGFKWRGADQIKVSKLSENGPFLVMVPFYTKDGKVEGYAFINGVYLGHAPYPGEE